MAPAGGEALKHFIFVVPEGATAEEEKKDTDSLVDAPVVSSLKVGGAGARLEGDMGGRFGWKRIPVEGQRRHDGFWHPFCLSKRDSSA